MIIRMPSELSNFDVVVFVNVTDADRAKAFYRDTLGLRFVGDELPFALVFDAHGIMLRLAIVKDKPAFPGTVLGWRASDIDATVRSLSDAGVSFNRYGSMQQDDLGIWTTPTGAKVAWFNDPDGNVLSLSQWPETA